jgi:ABC-type glycerol-3-phosphate transport system substrate-binding protein
MKRKVLLFIAVPLLLMGCKKQDGASGSSAAAPAENRISVWNFTDDFSPMFEFYQPDHPDVIIEHTYTPTDYDEKLNSALLSGQGAPDVFALNVNNARNYFESGLCLDITDIVEPAKNKLVKYQMEIGTIDSRVYGLSWQATPGAFYYRRSLAKQYLGTDDPETVQTYFSDLNKFMETAGLLYAKSGGSCSVISGYGELYDVFLPNRKEPWVVNGQLRIDPLMIQLMDVSKTLHEKGYEARVTYWTEGWYTSMKGLLQDERGSHVDVFGYFLPTWGLHFIFKANAPETSGDWALIPGPVRYYYGGTFVSAYKNTKNPETAKEFVRYITTDDAFLEKFAKKSGDLTSNIAVNDKIKNDFSDPFMGGQNHYALFAELAQTINGTLNQGTDAAVGTLFQEAVTAYVNNEKSRDQALEDFRAQAQSELGL